jgi:L-ascorbate metabolism protein UlaG (beta-lactamase superfamily)
VDVALLPIGDNYTMGPRDAARAVAFIEPEIVIPIHYNTFPPIEQDPTTFRERVHAEVDKQIDVRILQPGESTEF